jgi:Fungal specific transcription factor domain
LLFTFLLQARSTGKLSIHNLCFPFCAENIRAWQIGGTAVRAAIALGINMRNDSVRTPDTSKEIRYRVWWSLYALEHQLSMMTGRPTSVPDEACTTPLPIPMEEEAFHSQHAVSLLGADMQKSARYPGLLYRQQNRSGSATSSSDRSRSTSKPSSASRSPSTPQRVDFEWSKNVTPSSALYFLHYTQLNKKTQSILNRLYTPAAMQKSWSQIQSVMSELDQTIADWYNNLPTIFDFKRKQRDQNFVQQRMCLGFFYYGARIIINRPCLCRLDQKLPAQSLKSRDFNRASAITCIDSAREMLQMLPDEPNAVGLNRIGPWWCIVHHLMQATVVLLLELSFRSYHMPEEAEDVFEASKKAVRWLHKLGDESYSARRAWTLCDKMLREAAPKIGREVNHLPEQPPGPLIEPSYTNPETSLSDHSVATSVPTVMQISLQSGDNFTVSQQDLANMTVFAGYDEYLSYSDSERLMSFLPTSTELDFLNEAYHDPTQSDAYPEQ